MNAIYAQVLGVHRPARAVVALDAASGERVVVVGWMQSHCSDLRHREILFDLARVRQAVFQQSGKTTQFDLLSKTYSNLLRMFSS